MNDRIRNSREYSVWEDIELPDWSGALCIEVGPDVFFPRDNDSGSSKRAKKICAECSLQVKCLEFALEHNIQHGVWGGTSVMDRRRLRRMLRSGE